MIKQKNTIQVEVCVESIESALTAQRAGAYRVEFCDNMAEGGTTPSYGIILETRKLLDIKLYPMIRPRGGNFVYSDIEFEVMKRDIELFAQAGCDGVVLGVLRADGAIDIEKNAALIAIAKRMGLKVTFHRAFDVSSNLSRSLEDIISLGCERVLTSGGKATAAEGINKLKELIIQADNRIIVMPGSGIKPDNIKKIVKETGCREIHGTFRRQVEDAAIHKPDWADYKVWNTDEKQVYNALQMIKQPKNQ